MYLRVIAALAAVPVGVVLVSLLQAGYILATVPVLPEAKQDIRSSVTQTSNADGSEADKPSEYVVDMLVIGDSLAAGVGHASHKTAISGQLATQLLPQIHAYRQQHSGGKQPLKTTVKWQALARSGYTAARVLSKLVPRIAWEPLGVDSSQSADAVDGTTVQAATQAVKRTSTSKHSHHRLVVISNGVNHVFRLSSLASYRRELKQLLTALKRSSDNDISIAIIGIPDLSVFPAFTAPLRWLVGWRARQMSEATEQVVRELNWPNLVFCSFKLGERYPGALFTVDDVRRDAFFTRDGVHPAEYGCKLIAGLTVVPALAHLKYSLRLVDETSIAKRDTEWNVQLDHRN